MAIYKSRKGIHNSVIYYRKAEDGSYKAAKTITVPVNVVEALKTQDEVDEATLEESPPIKPCIFCGEHSKFERLIDTQTVYLCQKDYYSKTIGQVAEKVRKVGKYERPKQAEKIA